ncbi:MAG: cytochrome bc complex cytochrome b subunit [Desulfobacterales bacterium]|nr:cytochrome bc complex cytochrome b subunit [Desulfobacterales bacterium]
MIPEVPEKRSAFTHFLLHLHPRTVPVETLRYQLSFGLGGMAAALFATLIITGILQLLSYSPATLSAYQSIQLMYSGNNMGGYVRNIHFWAGNLLVIISALHLLRVFLTGALSGGRQLNWLIGMVIFLLVLFANFTGYLLPWDQLAFWAVTIFTNMTAYVPVIGGWLIETLRGGAEVGPATLENFFALHVGVLPAALIFLLIWHFWLIRKAGGLIQSPDLAGEHKKRVAVIPHLIQREAATGLCLLALLFVFSALVDAPLAGQANPGESPNPAKAAWYFMGLQELLLHLHPIFAICIAPLLVIAGFASLPFWPESTLPAAHWFGGKRGARLAILSFAGSFLTVVMAIVSNEFLFRTANSINTEKIWLTRGLLPLVTASLVLVTLFLFLRRKKNYSRADAVMAMVMATSGFIFGLTVIGIWFRGPGMALIWPI